MTDTRMGTHDTRVSDFFPETTTEVVISDSHTDYDDEIPNSVLADSDMLRSWLEDWMDDYLCVKAGQYLTGDEVKLQVINTDSRDVLYYGGFAVDTSIAEKN